MENIKLYEISYKDEEGDLYEEDFNTLSEAEKFMIEIESEGCEIVETWIYENDIFIGRF
jgi:hypothetical protein